MTTVWQRARSDAQKEQRKHALLGAASRLLAAHPIDEISLSGIARAANISKANVYRYFESREELFLRLFLDAADDWQRALVARLDRLAGSGDVSRVADALAQTTAEHEAFARLASVLATVLERNVSTEVVFDFKVRLISGAANVVVSVQAALPQLSLTSARELLQMLYFQSASLWPAAHPPPAVQAALERPELEGACVKFEPALRRSMEIAIAGLLALSE